MRGLTIWEATFVACACIATVLASSRGMANDEFVDCGAPAPEAFASLDVTIAIDTSMSTRNPSGSDIDGDGQIGDFERSNYTDPGDSLLAAEVAAARALIRSTADADIRYALVTFAGDFTPPGQHSPKRLVLKLDAVIRSELSRETAELELQLDRILERSSAGTTNFSAAMRLVNQSLSGTPDTARAARKRALFISDRATPLGGRQFRTFTTDLDSQRSDYLLGETTKKAIHGRIRFNTFGVGKAAEAATPHVLSAIAGATGGTFSAVTDPATLACALVTSLIGEPKSIRPEDNRLPRRYP